MSQINWEQIVENYPIAGQDNDTQTFRDNFNAIKTNFQYAKEEITDLQDNVVRKDRNNEFNNVIVSGLRFSNVRDFYHDAGTMNDSGPAPTVYYDNGPYQKITVGSNISLAIVGLPESSTLGVGRLLLEIERHQTVTDPVIITLSNEGAYEYRIANHNSRSFVISEPNQTLCLEIWQYNVGLRFVNYLGLFNRVT